MRVLTAMLVGLVVCASTSGANAKSEVGQSASAISKMTLTADWKGLATKTNSQVVEKTRNNPDEPPFMNGEPEHLRVTFDSDNVASFTNYLERQVVVYPVQPYAALFKGKEKEAFDRGMSQIKKIIATKSDKGVKEIPLLPSAEASEVFHAQVKYPAFKQGSGVSFVSAYMQDDAPIRNDDLFYTYQGLTKDGKYYVSLFYPVKVKGLPKATSSNPGVTYLKTLKRDQFTPNLDALDRAVQSISIQ